VDLQQQCYPIWTCSKHPVERQWVEQNVLIVVRVYLTGLLDQKHVGLGLGGQVGPSQGWKQLAGLCVRKCAAHCVVWDSQHGCGAHGQRLVQRRCNFWL